MTRYLPFLKKPPATIIVIKISKSKKKRETSIWISIFAKDLNNYASSNYPHPIYFQIVCIRCMCTQLSF